MVTKSQNFCANCGQKSPVHRFTIKHFIHESFHAFTHADKGLLHLLKELLLRPGVVAREYIAGKRKKYYNPFTFFLLLAAFYVLSGTIASSSTKEAAKVPAGIEHIKDPEAKKQALAIYERGIKSKVFMTKHSNIVAMVAVPFFAFLFWLFYLRRKYNYSEHLVASLMFVSFANLAFSLLVIPLQAVFKGSPYELAVTALGFVLQWIYFVVAYGGFMQLNGFWQRTKIIVVVLFGLVLWIFLSMNLIALYVYQNAHFYEFFKYMKR